MNQSLVFLNAPPLWVSVLIILPAMVALAWLPYSSANNKSSRKSAGTSSAVLCAGLRFTSFAVAAFLIMQPRINLRTTVSEPAPLAVVIDGSSSMSHRDTDDGSRIDWVNSFLNGEVIAELENRYAVSYFLTGDSLTLAQPQDTITADAPISGIGDGLVSIADEFRGRRLPDLLLLSDGRSNDGIELGHAANVLAQNRMRCFSVGVGTDNSVPDLVLEQVQVAQQVLSGDIALFTLRLKAISSDQLPSATIKLHDQFGNLLDTHQVIQPQADGHQFVMSASFEEPGEYKLTASVEAAPGELNLSNKRINLNLTVFNTKVRVLYVEGKPRWEYRYLKQRLIRSASDIEAQCWLAEADRMFEQEHSATTTALRQLPTDPEVLLEQYDVIIIGDVNPLQINHDPISSQDFINGVVKFVENGGGLLMLAGPENNPLQFLKTPLGNMLPVVIEANTKPLTEEYRPRPSDYSHPHPTSMLSSNLQENSALWQNATPLWWLFPSKRLKDGSQAWLISDSQENEFGPLVIAASHHVPHGQVAFIGTDETWRWRFPAGERYVQKFWRSALRNLASGRLHGNRGRIKLEAERNVVELGSSVLIEARLLDSSYRPVYLDEGIPLFNDEGDKILSLQLNQNDPDVSYSAKLRPEILGDLELYITEDSKPDSNISARLNLNVILTSKEMSNLSLNREGLSHLAAQTNGSYLAANNAAQALNFLDGGKPIVRVVDQKFSFIKPWWAFSVFFAAIVGEWIIRKRRNQC
ncbi:MAG: hypothetical protein QGF46_00675 [Planctomycetota bacterium]|nr:hypothetical protein [Planctomycetota bacterium]